MVNAIPAGLQEGEAVMARIDVKEKRLERLEDVIAEVEVEHVPVEGNDIIQAFDGEYRMTHPERPGAKARDRAPRPERLTRNFRAVKCLKPVTDRVGEHDQ